MSQQQKVKELASLAESRAVLVELLGQGDLPIIHGLWEISEKDRANLMVSCCAEVIAFTVTMIAGYDRQDAQRGAKALWNDMVRRIDTLCKEHTS